MTTGFEKYRLCGGVTKPPYSTVLLSPWVAVNAAQSQRCDKRRENADMLQIAFFLLSISICVFSWIMIHDPRTLWSGISLLGMLLCSAVTMFFLLSEYANWLAEHELLMNILVALLLLTAGCVLMFPVILIVTLFVEGIKVIRHEGLRPSNLLTMLFSVLLYLYLAVWPVAGGLEKGRLGTKLYLFVSLSAAYMLSLMAIYLLSAALNLLHWKKRRGADYVVVLGAGVIGTRVTPLLAARIERGIELLHSNPGAVLIMSGGQGPGEDVAEGEAMARYAEEQGVGIEKIIVEGRSKSTEENLLFSSGLMEKDRPKVVVVTTSYHVFRALLLAKQQGLKCVGFGAKTKWYFTLNALIREFIGYLSLTWKQHTVMAALIFIVITVAI